MTFTLIIVTIVVLLTFVLLRIYNKKTNDLPPGPWSVPLLGSLFWLDPQTPHLSLAKLSKKFGPIYSLKLGRLNAVVISDAKLARKILIRDEATGTAPFYLFDVLTKRKGILFTEGELWKEQRKFLSHFLKTSGASRISQNKKHMEKHIVQCVDDFVEYIKVRGGRVVVNVSEDLVHNVASVYTSIFLGKKWQRDDPFWKHLLHLLDEGAKLVGVAGPLNFIPFLRFLPPYRKVFKFLNEVYNTMRSTCSKVITEMNEEHSGQNFIKVFLQQAHDDKQIYTEEQLTCLLIDLFAASVEATTNSILWTLLFLAEHRKIQSRLRQELSAFSLVTVDDVSSFPLMEATIAEVARIRTVVPLGMPHCVLDDLTIEDLTIPKGTTIITFLWGIHMDPKIWKNPDEFRPGRFLDESGRFYKPDSFMPFQAGKRICLGEGLAKMVIFLFLSVVLKNFEINSGTIECDVNLDGVCGSTLKPKPQNLVFIKL